MGGSCGGSGRKRSKSSLHGGIVVVRSSSISSGT